MKNIERKTHTINASGKAAGRLASEIAIVLRGKNKPEYTPQLDLGDNVVVTNIGKLKFSGKKIEQKKYYRYSGYPGGLKKINMSEIFEKNSGEVLKRAVRDMLPANKLRNGMLKRLVIK